MIEISRPKCIDGESLQEWLVSFIEGALASKKIYLLPREPFDCTSESNAFTAVDSDSPISKSELLLRQADVENDRFAYFYIDDVVNAACGAGILTDTYYHVFHKNSH